jgi:transcription elongation factor GreA
MLLDAVVLTEPQEHDSVQLGSHVTVMDAEGETTVFQIVGSAEADPGNGRISNESPVGKALMGHRSGEMVAAQAPGGKLTFTIVSIR